MKTQKILSLFLAVLMIVSAVPMIFVPATAEEAAPAPVAGTAPATLPNGKSPTAITFHTYDAAAKYRENTAGWHGEFATGVMTMLQNGAEGIMFKVTPPMRRKPPEQPSVPPDPEASAWRS